MGLRLNFAVARPYQNQTWFTPPPRVRMLLTIAVKGYCHQVLINWIRFYLPLLVTVHAYMYSINASVLNTLSDFALFFWENTQSLFKIKVQGCSTPLNWFKLKTFLSQISPVLYGAVPLWYCSVPGGYILRPLRDIYHSTLHQGTTPSLYLAYHAHISQCPSRVHGVVL